MVGELGCLPPPISLARLSSAAQELVGCSCAPPLLSSVVHLCIFEDICLTLDRQRIWGKRKNVWPHSKKKVVPLSSSFCDL